MNPAVALIFLGLYAFTVGVIGGIIITTLVKTFGYYISLKKAILIMSLYYFLCLIFRVIFVTYVNFTGPGYPIPPEDAAVYPLLFFILPITSILEVVLITTILNLSKERIPVIKGLVIGLVTALTLAVINYGGFILLFFKIFFGETDGGRGG